MKHTSGPTYTPDVVMHVLPCRPLFSPRTQSPPPRILLNHDEVYYAKAAKRPPLTKTLRFVRRTAIICVLEKNTCFCAVMKDFLHLAVSSTAVAMNRGLKIVTAEMEQYFRRGYWLYANGTNKKARSRRRSKYCRKSTARENYRHISCNFAIFFFLVSLAFFCLFISLHKDMQTRRYYTISTIKYPVSQEDKYHK